MLQTYLQKWLDSKINYIHLHAVLLPVSCNHLSGKRIEIFRCGQFRDTHCWIYWLVYYQHVSTQ